MRRAREARGFTLQEIGPLLDCSPEAPRLWEIGRHRPHPRFHARLEAILGAPIEVLLTPEKENGPER